jgi:ubiquinone/menaquinone biosynthesis C-methylase UbiE
MARLRLVNFSVSADAYDRFMGRYSVPLGPRFADFAGVTAPQQALDVGCGPGALTSELVRRLADFVSAVDPSESFVTAARERHPGVDVRLASAESLAFGGATFDAALAQLVVHFMADPVAGLAEMARVTRAGGVVAACVWDHAGDQGPLSLFWRAVRRLDPEVEGESLLAGTGAGELARLLDTAGLGVIEEAALSVSVEHLSFDEWWQPLTLGVGPAGAYTAALDVGRRAQLRETCRELLATEPFVLPAQAWAVRGVV